MADFKKFGLTKQVPITYGNSTDVAAQAGDEPMRAARSIGTDRAFEAAAKALHLNWTPEGVHALIAAADAFVAAQVSPRATADVERDKAVCDLVRLWDSESVSAADYNEEMCRIEAIIRATTRPAPTEAAQGEDSAQVDATPCPGCDHCVCPR